MEWSLSRSREEGLQTALDEFMAKISCNLEDVQKIHGKLSNFSQACDFIKRLLFQLAANADKICRL